MTRRPSTMPCPGGDGTLSLVHCGVEAHQFRGRGNKEYRAAYPPADRCPGRVYVHNDHEPETPPCAFEGTS